MWKHKKCGGEIVLKEIISQTWKVEKNLDTKELSSDPEGEDCFYLCKECNTKTRTSGQIALKRIAKWEEE